MPGHETSLPLTADDAEIFQQDGAVCIRQAVDAATVTAIRDAIEWTMANPGPYAQDLTNGETAGAYFADIFCASRNPRLKPLIVTEHLAAIAGHLLGARHVRFYVDHLLVMEPGSSEPTPWHQDFPYWPMEGAQSCSVWIALDPVTAASGAVEYLRGSHATGQTYAPRSFQKTEQLSHGDLAQMPDIDADRGSYDLLRWDMQPGDVTVHHSLTVHGSPGNRERGTRRRGLAVRFMGEQVTYRAREAVPAVMRAAFQDLAPHLTDGKGFSGDLFPELWAQS